MNPDFQTIGEQFTTSYYPIFDSNRAALRALYRPDSMLTFEGTQFQGTEQIAEKLMGLPFTKVVHAVTTTDSQPIQNLGVLVFVVGQLKTDEDPPHSFSQTFVLMPTDSACSSYYVMNDVFRLSLHHQ